MISASKSTLSLNNLKNLRPKVTKNLMNSPKKLCEFQLCSYQNCCYNLSGSVLISVSASPIPRQLGVEKFVLGFVTDQLGPLDSADKRILENFQNNLRINCCLRDNLSDILWTAFSDFRCFLVVKCLPVHFESVVSNRISSLATFVARGMPK